MLPLFSKNLNQPLPVLGGKASQRQSAIAAIIPQKEHSFFYGNGVDFAEKRIDYRLQGLLQGSGSVKISVQGGGCHGLRSLGIQIGNYGNYAMSAQGNDRNGLVVIS